MYSGRSQKIGDNEIYNDSKLSAFFLFFLIMPCVKAPILQHEIKIIV